MYNRYIPQADGTYQRNRLPDSIPRKPIPTDVPRTISHPPAQPEEPSCPVPQNRPEPRPEPRRAPPRHPGPQKRDCGSVTSFLKQLLPQNFDTADLLVVLLLLLMSGEGAEDQNTALLTLALYLFL